MRIIKKKFKRDEYLDYIVKGLEYGFFRTKDKKFLVNKSFFDFINAGIKNGTLEIKKGKIDFNTETIVKEVKRYAVAKLEV